MVSLPRGARVPPVERAAKVGALAALGTEALYGGSFVFTKGVTETIDPFTLLAWRFGVALGVLLVLVALRVVRLTLSCASVAPLLVLAFLQPLAYYAAETYGVMRTTASESALIISAIPVVMLVTAAVIVGTRPSRRQATGIAVTLMGVLVVVAASGLSARFDPLGYLLLFGAVLAFSLYAAFAHRFADTTDVDRTFVMVASGAAVFGAIALAQHGVAGTIPTLVSLPLAQPSFGVAVAFLALGPTIGAFFLQNVAIRHLGATRFSTFIGMSTLVTIVLGASVLGERLGWAQWLGGVAILGGVYLANRRHRGEPLGD